jgi:signal transduction histidine kinase
MEDEQKERLFEPRFTTKSKGMGLGLAMVKRIVEQSAAEIRFDSRLEEGTCFYITLLKK